ISQGAVDLNDHTRRYVVSQTRPSRLRETIDDRRDREKERAESFLYSAE
ncbi:hypothetical protein GBAR_LOCUS24864, partial [Geodia barretti]